MTLEEHETNETAVWNYYENKVANLVYERDKQKKLTVFITTNEY